MVFPLLRFPGRMLAVSREALNSGFDPPLRLRDARAPQRLAVVALSFQP
jgi:hypothetical protein